MFASVCRLARPPRRTLSTSELPLLPLTPNSAPPVHRGGGGLSLSPGFGGAGKVNVLSPKGTGLVGTVKSASFSCGCARAGEARARRKTATVQARMDRLLISGSDEDVGGT